MSPVLEHGRGRQAEEGRDAEGEEMLRAGVEAREEAGEGAGAIPAPEGVLAEEEAGREESRTVRR